MPHQLLNSVHPSLPKTSCDTVSVLHAPASKAPVVSNAPNVTFPVPFRSFHAPVTHSWETLPDSVPSSLHHSTATFSLLTRCHTSLRQPPSAHSPGPASVLLLPSLQQPPLPRRSPAMTSPTRSGLSISVDVPSGALCPRTYKPSSFQSPLASLGFISQASSVLGPPSWQFSLEPLRAIPAQRHHSGALMPTSICSLSAWSWVLLLHV